MSDSGGSDQHMSTASTNTTKVNGSRRSRKVKVAPKEELTSNGFEFNDKSNPIGPQMRLLDSSKATDRSDGLQQLAEALRQDPTKIAESLDEAAWEHLVSWTARILTKETQTYVNRHSDDDSHELSAAAERLRGKIQTQYLSHIRHIWAVAQPYLSERGAKSLIKHIISSITDDPCLIHVLGADYGKTLAAWATFEPHIRSCKDGRIETLVDLCMKWLIPEFNDISPDSKVAGVNPIRKSSDVVLPGDVEYVSMLLSIIRSASPIQLDKLGTKVLRFCTEYCQVYTRENACTAMIMDIANTILLAQPDKQMIGDSDQLLLSLLESSVQLWTTRLTHLKLSVLYNIRILTRILAPRLAILKEPDIKLISLFEWTLKALMSGDWARFDFMKLPTDMLTIWPVVNTRRTDSGFSSPLFPLQRLAKVSSAIDAYQVAFFDTLAFLVTTLTASQNRFSRYQDPQEHRKKRQRAAPSSLFRLKESLKQTNEPRDTVKAAQIVWFITNFYACALGADERQDILEAIQRRVLKTEFARDSDTELRPWIWGIYVSLMADSPRMSTMLTLESHMRDNKVLAGYNVFDCLKEGVPGAGALAFLLLHSAPINVPAAEVREFCGRVAESLALVGSGSQPDVLQLRILLAHFFKREDITKDIEISVVSICTYAAEHHWSICAFSFIIQGAFGFAGLSTDEIDEPSLVAILQPQWRMEILFLQHILQMADAFADGSQVCQILHNFEEECNPNRDTISSANASKSNLASNLTPGQWDQIANLIVRGGTTDSLFGHQLKYTPENVYPYLALTTYHICHYVEDTATTLESHIGSEFSERLLAILTDADGFAHAWETLTAISPWLKAYSNIANLVEPMNQLLDVLFDPSNPSRLCALVSGENDGGSGSHFKVSNPFSLSTTSNAKLSADAARKRCDSSLEMTMLSTVSGLARKPWSPVIDTLTVLLMTNEELEQTVSNKIGKMVDKMDTSSFLQCCGFLAHCVSLSSSSSSQTHLMGKLRARFLACLESYYYVGHMPAMFSILQAVKVLSGYASKSTDDNEYISQLFEWIADEIQNGRVGTSVTIHFIRTIAGPWGRQKDTSLCNVLKDSSLDPSLILVRQAQTSSSFAVRVVAEEELAKYQLFLPYLLPNGSLDYPDAPVTRAGVPAVDDMLVLMTRDIGLAMLVCKVGHIIPGVLSILLRQVYSQSECSEAVTRLCHRLLGFIARVIGYKQPVDMIQGYTTSLISLDPNLPVFVADYLRVQMAAEQQDRLLFEAVLSYICKDDLEGAKTCWGLIGGDSASTGSKKMAPWPTEILAHLLVLLVNDPEKFKQVDMDVFYPAPVSDQIQKAISERPEELIMHVLSLCRPAVAIAYDIKQVLEAINSSEQSQRQLPLAHAYFKCICEESGGNLGATRLSQWGQLYEPQMLVKSVYYIAQNSTTAVPLEEFLTTSRIAWIIIHLHFKLKKMAPGDVKCHLATALNMLIGLANPTLIATPFVQPLLFRALVDCWLCGDLNTSVHMCLTACLLLDMVTLRNKNGAGSLFSDLSVGYLTQFTELLVTHSLQTPAELAIQPFGCLIKTVAMATGSTGISDVHKVYIGQEIQPYYSWDDFPTLLVTDHIVRNSDDRAGLANIASRAVTLLNINYYAPACAEALVRSIERLLQLALPMERTANGTLPSLVYSVDLASQFGNEYDDPNRAGSEDACSMQLDLSSDVLSLLSNIYKIVLRFTRKVRSLEHSKKSTTAMLLRSVSLLQAIKTATDSQQQQQQQQQDASTSEASNSKGEEIELKRLKDGGDLRCVFSEMLTMSRDQTAVLATIQIVTQLSNSGDNNILGEESLNSLVAWQRWVLSDVMAMPPLMVDVYNSLGCLRKYTDQKQSLNLPHLESLCDVNKSSNLALSELVCSLISYGECNKYKPAIPLILESPEVATVLLPHVLYDILPQASDDSRREIAAFLLDLAYNWRIRDPGMAIDVIDKTLAVRQLDECYLDIREFFQHLPIPLFEVANLAVYLGAPETAAFLLECDLTCTGRHTLSNVEEITVEARSLLREIYMSLGNQPAAQLVSPVKNVDDIMSRCQDTGDWSTLLLLQEAQPNFAPVTDPTTDQLQTRDTLLRLGLLNTLISMSDNATNSICGGSVNGNHSQAMFGASWRLGKWDIPHTPLSHLPLANSLSKAENSKLLFLSPVDRPEEALYSILRLRALGQHSEAEMAVQEYMSSPAAISAITQPTKGLRGTWSYRALSMLIPLVRTIETEDSFSVDEEFVQASRVVSFLLSKCYGGESGSTSSMSGVSEFVYQANLSLHEIVMRELVTNCSPQTNKSHVFARYKDAARMAWWASSKTKNWQNAMSYSHRLHYMKDAANYQDKTLHLELLLWNTETLWSSGNRDLAIELLQVHKKKLEDSLSRITVVPDNHDTNDDDVMVITPVVPDPMTMSSVSTPSNLQPLSAMSTCSVICNRSGAPGPESAPESKIKWKRSELDTANIHLSRIITTVGEWMDIERKERPTVLWDEYFRKSTKIIENISHPTAWTGRALHALASFAERQCIEMAGTRDDAAINRVRKQKLRELEACRSEISRATSSGAELNKLKAIVRRLEIQVDTDENELGELRNNIKAFLELAIRSFVKCLEYTNAFDSCVYSLFSLIVTNARAPELQRILVPGLFDAVPSSKLIPLVHQICARLSTEDSMFHNTIFHLVMRMAIDYPFHTMYHLFALRNANRTQPTATASHRRSDRLSYLPGGEDMEMLRNKAAVQILTDVSGVNTTLHNIIEAINNLCSAYIELAVASVPEHNKSDTLGDKIIRFKNTSRIAKMSKHLAPNLPVLTASQPIGVPRDYSDVPFISSIVKGYSLAGGINLPKILRLVGSDGKKYKELVKGKDDLRQDAIIQQLFHVMNGVLLPRSTGTSAGGLCERGDLSIRTYQVVPLTKRCGVLQWVDNTLPFGVWFQHNEQKYRPDAPPLTKRRLAIHEVHKNKEATAQQKLDIFNEVCNRAPPVFRFFFYEQFSNAQSWFEHRERYIRSAAVSSMAGWVLGIGDRHLQNILIDRSTAEFVHIDLGIAFDMGKLLPIPELVPFRLTREIIDGMGMLGLNGTFKHSCQVSLQAMRDHAHIIITILNVLKVDPLYMWSLVPLRMDKMKRAGPSREGGEYITDRNGVLRRRTMSKIAAAGYGYVDEDDAEEEDDDIESYNSGKSSSAAVVAAAAEENEEAGRSIMHVGQRLKATISVDGQVNELIQQATNPELLSRLFEGWSAWY